MNAKQFLKEHETEALKKIAETMGKVVFIRTQVFSHREVCYCDDSGNEEVFNPLTNAEQWIECLMRYIDKVWDRQGAIHVCHRKISQSVDTREALLVAILEMTGGWDEKEI